MVSPIICDFWAKLFAVEHLRPISVNFFGQCGRIYVEGWIPQIARIPAKVTNPQLRHSQKFFRLKLLGHVVGKYFKPQDGPM